LSRLNFTRPKITIDGTTHRYYLLRILYAMCLYHDVKCFELTSNKAVD